MMLLTLGLFTSLIISAFSVPNPLPGSDNVVVRDPAIWYNSDAKKYFVFSTGDNIKIFTGSSLTGPWTRAGSVVSNGSNTSNSGGRGYWGPDVNFVDGHYVLYYSTSAVSSQDSVMGVATSPSMEPGSWTDLGEVISSKEGQRYNAIAANLIHAAGLKLSFGSYNDGIFQVSMSNVSTPTAPPPGIHLEGGNDRPSEGGFQYKSKSSDYYYLFFSDGYTPLVNATKRPPPGQEYKVLVGRSHNISGPYVDENGNKLTQSHSGSLVLGSHDNIYAPGGQSIFEDPVSGRDVMVYHYVPNNSYGGPSYLGVNYLDFSSEWPVVVEK